MGDEEGKKKKKSYGPCVTLAEGKRCTVVLYASVPYVPSLIKQPTSQHPRVNRRIFRAESTCFISVLAALPGARQLFDAPSVPRKVIFLNAYSRHMDKQRVL